jgi:hypothetical protein
VLIVIPFNAAQSELAERLCDFVYFLSGKVQSGSCLLVSSTDVHPEQRLKVQLAAEVAFEYVDITVATTNLFDASINKVNNCYKSCWLYLEPESVPLKKDWREELELAYKIQPKRYFGAHVKNEAGELFLGRQSVYPSDALKDYDGKYNFIAGSTKSRLVQQTKWTGRQDIRSDAVLFCSDASGELIKTLRSELK